MSAVTFYSGGADVNKVDRVVVEELFSLYSYDLSHMLI